MMTGAERDEEEVVEDRGFTATLRHGLIRPMGPEDRTGKGRAKLERLGGNTRLEVDLPVSSSAILVHCSLRIRAPERARRRDLYLCEKVLPLQASPTWAST